MGVGHWKSLETASWKIGGRFFYIKYYERTVLSREKKEKEKTSPKAVRGHLRRRCNRESDPAGL